MGLMEELVFQDQTDSKDSKGGPVLLEHLDPQDLQVLLEQQGQLEQQEQQAGQGILVLQEVRDPLDHEETRVLQDNMVCLE